MGKNLQLLMERNRDLRRENKSSINGLPRRRQSNVTATNLRDSSEEERQMELHERFRDRERLLKKDRDREFSKKRRVDRFDESTDASDEEYLEEEEAKRRGNLNRMNQQASALSSSVSNNRRNLRTLRSAPVDEMIGVPVPRRARSTSTKRLHEYWNSGNGEGHRGFTPSPSPASLAGAGGSSPSSSGGTMKKKTKCAETRKHGLNNSANSRSSSAIQDDIEIEVAEALFDLMKQSQSQFQSSKNHEKLDRDSENTDNDELKADGGKNENSATVDSKEGMQKDEKIEKEKFSDNSGGESVSGDGFVIKEKDVSPESESPSHVKVNASENQDPIATKVDYAPIAVETKREARLDIDLMAPPPLASSPEREVLNDIASDPKCMAQNIQKKSETISKDGPSAVLNPPEEEKIGAVRNNQLPNLDLEKRYHDSSICIQQQQQGKKEQKNQLQTSLLHFPNMNGWPGVLPHPAYMPPMQKPLPTDESTRSSFGVQLQTPKFTLSQPRAKRCATHEYIARNIHDHHQLIKNSLSSSPAANIYGNRQVHLNSMPLSQKGQNLSTISGGSGKDKSSEVSSSVNATKGKNPLLQQAPANNFMAPGFIFPLGHHQAPYNQSSSVSFNNPNLPSNESASQYMAILQNNNGYQFQMPTLKVSGTTQSPPTVPLFNPSFYSSQIFNVPQRQQQPQIPFPPQNTSMSSESSSIKPQTGIKISDNNNLPSNPTTTRPSDKEMSRRGITSFPTQPINFTMTPPGAMQQQQQQQQQQGGSKAAFSLPFGSNASTNSALNFSPNPTMFEVLPEMAWNSYQMSQQQQQRNFQTPEGKSSTGSKNIDGLKGSSIFDNLPRSVNFVPSNLPGNQQQSFSPSLMQNFHQHQHQQQLIQLQNHHMQQMQMNQTTQMKASRNENSPKSSHISFSNNSPVLPAATQGASIIGSPSNSSTSKNTLANSQQQMEASTNGSNQKSSPACRRNVPSILSTTRSSQLPEIKYG